MERRPLCGCEYGVEVELRSCLVTVRSWQQRTAAWHDRFWRGGGDLKETDTFSVPEEIVPIYMRTLWFPKFSQCFIRTFQSVLVADASEYARHYVDISSREDEREVNAKKKASENLRNFTF
jgi:hypothetical protein